MGTGAQRVQARHSMSRELCRLTAQQSCRQVRTARSHLNMRDSAVGDLQIDSDTAGERVRIDARAYPWSASLAASAVAHDVVGSARPHSAAR
jgi:hypothetical protein